MNELSKDLLVPGSLVLAALLIFIQRKRLVYLSCPKDVISPGKKLSYLFAHVLFSVIVAFGLTQLTMGWRETLPSSLIDANGMVVFIGLSTIIFLFFSKPLSALIAANNKAYKLWKYIKKK